MPIDPDSRFPDAGFLAALNLAFQDGRAVQLERSTTESMKYIFTGRVVGVDPAEGRCFVLRGEETEPRSYWLRYLFRLIDANGAETLNPEAPARYEEILKRRKRLAEEGQRVLVDPNYVLSPVHVTNTFTDTVDGVINGEPAKFYVFRSTETNPRLVVVYAVNEQAAERCMRLLDSEHGIWLIFATYLQSRFLWPAWLTLRTDAQNLAKEVRAGRAVLSADADWSQRDERETLYESGGLSHDNFGPVANLDSLECGDWDMFEIFDLAERVPATLLNHYLTVAWRSAQYFDELDGVDGSVLRDFIHYGLAAKRPEPTIDDALDHIPMAKLRELVSLVGTGFKARSGSMLREHLLAHMTPTLAAEAKNRTKMPMHQLLPPPGWTWEQFQDFRSDYRFMLNALHRWLFNGWAPTAASKRFEAMV